jgi:hypothetical protein
MTRSRILLVSLLLLACGDPLPPSMKLLVVARVLTPTVAVDDTAKVRIVAINRMSYPVTVTSPSSCAFDLFVYDAANREVDRSRMMCTQAFSDLTIPAHDSVFQVIALRILAFDGSKLVSPQPGNYKVRGALAVMPSAVWSEAVPLRIE